MPSETKPSPQQQPERVATQAPAPLPQQPTGAVTGFQYTQIQQTIPPQCWTTDVLEQYLTLLAANDDKNRTAFENQNKREHRLHWAGFGLISIIILFGCVLVYQGNPFGRDIIGATVLFLAGFLAGQGSVKKQ